MSKRKRKSELLQDSAPSELRVIGGSLRGSKLRYQQFRNSDDPVTRPMKHRVREAIFNLISTDSAGKHAIDLFAGTGALGIEALSRGAVSATFIERHVPTSHVIRENIDGLGLADRSQLLVTSAFLWARRDLPRWCESKSTDQVLSLDHPWLIFCSPPYAFYQDKQSEMLALVETLQEHSPAGSILVVEADQNFDFQLLSGGREESRRGQDGSWVIREYPPAVVGIFRT